MVDIAEYRRESDSRMIKMEKDIEYIKQTQETFKADLKESNYLIDKKFDKVISHIDAKFETMDSHIKELDKKYANKYVEKIMWVIISVSITIIMGAIFRLIFI